MVLLVQCSEKYLNRLLILKEANKEVAMDMWRF